MENFKNQFEIELDPFENYVDMTIEALDEKWRLVAQKVIGETDETRQIGIQTLKVLLYHNKIVYRKKSTRL